MQADKVIQVSKPAIESAGSNQANCRQNDRQCAFLVFVDGRRSPTFSNRDINAARGPLDKPVAPPPPPQFAVGANPYECEKCVSFKMNLLDWSAPAASA